MTAFLSRLFRRPREDAPVWIEVGELQRRLAAGDAVVVVDVRQPEEFTAPPGHLPGAVNVPLAELRGVHPIILIGAATLLGAVTGFYILKGPRAVGVDLKPLPLALHSGFQTLL